MSLPRDGWDADEREALDGLEEELAQIQQRHVDDPPLAMLRAADENALPPELQAQVASHLQGSAWSRALVDGLRHTDADVELDAATEQRIFDRITTRTEAASWRGRRRALAFGGLALAATVLIGVVLWRPSSALPPPSLDRIAAPPAPPAIEIAVTKPEIRLTPAVLTWRGSASASPLVEALVPAVSAYRANDYVRAAAEFDQLSSAYPDAIEVRFYQGVSHLLAGDAAGAVAPLEAAARLRSVPFTDDVSWYLAVAEQRAGIAGARERFAEQCRGGGAHAAEACTASAQLSSPTGPR